MAYDRQQGAKGARGAPEPGSVALMKPGDFNNYLVQRYTPAIERVIAPGALLRTQQIIGQAVTAYTQSEALQKCIPQSIANAVVYAAQVGLEICTARGYAWLIPYKNKCTYQIGYKGLVELGHQSGKIHWPTAEVVYEGDEFINELDSDGLVFKYRKSLKKPDPEGWVGAFVYVTFLNGQKPYAHFMRRDQIEAIRDKSSQSAYASGATKLPEHLQGPWRDYPDEMRRKTVVKQGFKMLQLSPSMSFAIGADDQAEAKGRQELHPVILERDGGEDGEYTYHEPGKRGPSTSGVANTAPEPDPKLCNLDYMPQPGEGLALERNFVPVGKDSQAWIKDVFSDALKIIPEVVKKRFGPGSGNAAHINSYLSRYVDSPGKFLDAVEELRAQAEDVARRRK